MVSSRVVGSVDDAVASFEERPSLVDVASIRAAYATHARPRTAAVLRAIGLDVVFHRAEGDYLYFSEPDGREVRVLDLLGGFGANLFGHNNRELVHALCEGVRSGLPTHAQASVRRFGAHLAERLSSFAKRATGREYVVTFSNSGAEAVEAAIKHAELEERARAIAAVERQRVNVLRARVELAAARQPPVAGAGLAVTRESLDEIAKDTAAAFDPPALAVALKGAFHGKTLGALRLTHNPRYRETWDRGDRAVFVDVEAPGDLERVFERQTYRYRGVEFDDIGQAVIEPRERVAITGIFVEAIQGEGGIRSVPEEFLRRARALADRTGVPLVFDEIQCGMGRTGSFFASEATGIDGDYYVMAKALGGGLTKIGATLVAAERYQTEFGYLHTSTFSEDDPTCLVALKALELVERGDGALMRECRRKGAFLLAELSRLQVSFPDIVESVRGRGLLVGVQLAPPAGASSPMLRVLSEQNLLGFVAAGYLFREARIRVAPTLSSHGTLRVEPSAFVPEAELVRFVNALGKFCALLQRGDVAKVLSFAFPDEAAPSSARLCAPRASEPSAPATAMRADGPSASTRVAFLAHFRGGRDVRLFEPGFEVHSAEACEAFVARVRPVLEPFALATREIRSPTGAATQLQVVGIPFTANEASEGLRGRATRDLVEAIRGGVSVARDFGATVIGCGGYTSILTDNCRDLLAEDHAVTSGNSLTVAATLEAVDLAARELGLQRRVLGIVGALGNIGAALAELLSESVDEVVLVGRPGAARRLERLASRLAGPVRIATEMDALRACNMIVSASNAPAPIIRSEHLNEQPLLVCDVAVPRDVDPGVATRRPRARIIRGGIVRLPLEQSIDVPALDLPRGRVYACLGEALLFGLSRVTDGFSVGPIEPTRVRKLAALAREHSFSIDIDEWQPGLEG